MTRVPDRPKIYHLTHVDNISAIVAAEGLVSDRAMLARGGPPRAIGMSRIKKRRVERLSVSCHPDTMVGDYVPFYFCPRSVMLYVIHCANNPELTYRGGQDPIVHLSADLHEVVDWAEEHGRRWAFSLSNAGAFYAEFRARLEDLGSLDWNAIASIDFRDSDTRGRKQAEFLVHGYFPFGLIEAIGTISETVRARVSGALLGTEYSPRVEVRPEWYYR
ncbi:MAG: DUF4433 domain-containing protein [Candidatus Eisenbacteria bacterium]|nr:DUF4433 domain-containing protein [Candidatus Eisenbacteria bacterium]